MHAQHKPGKLAVHALNPLRDEHLLSSYSASFPVRVPATPLMRPAWLRFKFAAPPSSFPLDCVKCPYMARLEIAAYRWRRMRRSCSSGSGFVLGCFIFASFGCDSCALTSPPATSTPCSFKIHTASSAASSVSNPTKQYPLHSKVSLLRTTEQVMVKRAARKLLPASFGASPLSIAHSGSDAVGEASGGADASPSSAPGSDGVGEASGGADASPSSAPVSRCASAAAAAAAAISSDRWQLSLRTCRTLASTASSSQSGGSPLTCTWVNPALWASFLAALLSCTIGTSPSKMARRS
mmetsp:Transcript_42085/g.112472  ORF Transcript_42085/g.112472 Transcript_42085/m.112472 type:complete len:295 (+) Transcript_42085:51-935(+)